MAEDQMRYDLLTQKALMAVVRDALRIAATEGLPGEHHFYISFRTEAPGVDISDRLKAQYPEEMTIVLQHQFWDLKISETGFSVGLSFDKTPEKLVIPFSALQGFFDPSVQFGLQFTGEAGPDGTDTPDISREETEQATPETNGEKAAGEVVSLDAFRKDR
ncbi:MAG: hypothetical protein JJ939_03070 [Alphaproteobacteria bacterium]|jgi:hypothetical protein|nr:hypothetical protein [Alphaproteobacteria bacterium]MBO6627383.1 hypothetical protein [Alphaproteobacteria bacterium]MDF1626955.1 ClpXP protease specificity-enhancing factor SspB [Parvibaculaceae bacterium]|tara:strand:+ start:523 stop:1005 length:483 start_codon:yes stop_codon:yes gene_type:complete